MEYTRCKICFGKPKHIQFTTENCRMKYLILFLLLRSKVEQFSIFAAVKILKCVYFWPLSGHNIINNGLTYFILVSKWPYWRDLSIEPSVAGVRWKLLPGSPKNRRSAAYRESDARDIFSTYGVLLWKFTTRRVYKLETSFLWLSSSFVFSYMGKIKLELIYAP